VYNINYDIIIHKSIFSSRRFYQNHRRLDGDFTYLKKRTS